MIDKDRLYNLFLILLSIINSAFALYCISDKQYEFGLSSFMIFALSSQLLLARAKCKEVEKENKAIHRWLNVAFKSTKQVRAPRSERTA